MDNNSKRFFWLKLNENFFNDETIEWIEEQDNGKDYLLFYLKLCLLSLKHNGKIYREIGNMTIPYDVTKLAEVTKTSVDTVRVATKVLVDVGLVQQMDDMTLFMSQLESMVGSSADNSNAERQRRFRARQKQKELPQNVTKNVTENNVTSNESIEYRDKSIEYRDKSIEYSIGDKSPTTPTKKHRKTKKAFIPPSIDDVKAYVAEKGLSVDAERFHEYYSAGEWHDAKGNGIKNWKQKLLTWSRYEEGSRNASSRKPVGEYVPEAWEESTGPWE